MFKTIKYLFLASLYRKAKKSFMMLFVYVILLILFNFIIDDIINIASSELVYILLLIKWVVVLSLLSFIAFHLLKIFNIATNPFEAKSTDKEIDDTKQTSSDIKKERILHKEKLFTQSDLIMQKYTKG